MAPRSRGPTRGPKHRGTRHKPPFDTRKISGSHRWENQRAIHTAKADPPTERKVTEGDKQEGAPRSEEKPKKQRTALDSNLADCMRLKARMLAIMSKTSNLSRMVRTDARWAWANSGEIIGKVVSDQSRGGLQTQTSTRCFDFHDKHNPKVVEAEGVLNRGIEGNNLGGYLQSESRDLKASAPAEVVLDQCRQFLALAEHVKALEVVHSQVLRMAKARAP